MQGWVMNYQKTFALMSPFTGLFIAGLFLTEGVAFWEPCVSQAWWWLEAVILVPFALLSYRKGDVGFPGLYVGPRVNEVWGRLSCQNFSLSLRSCIYFSPFFSSSLLFGLSGSFFMTHPSIPQERDLLPFIQFPVMQLLSALTHAKYWVLWRYSLHLVFAFVFWTTLKKVDTEIEQGTKSAVLLKK